MEQDIFQELREKGKVVIRVSPNKETTSVTEKTDDGKWKLSLHAPAHEGKANAEVLRFFRKVGGVDAEIVFGRKSKEKLIRIIP